jgi:hypothetical protein
MFASEDDAKTSSGEPVQMRSRGFFQKFAQIEPLFSPPSREQVFGMQEKICNKKQMKKS